MSHCWLLITFTWFGTVSLQFINTAGPGAADTLLDPQDSSVHFPPLPYTSYHNLPLSRENYDMPTDYQMDEEHQRKRRTVDDKDSGEKWSNTIETDKTDYYPDDQQNIVNPYFVALHAALKNDSDVIDIDKRNFSPWGGKRDSDSERMWSWKREANPKEPSMPKRVRFSPWGGKRSGQNFIYKQGGKGSIIYSANGPELPRIISSYSPGDEQFNLAGFKLIPLLDKRHPVKVMALTKVDGGLPRDALPYNTFLENLPKLFKSGHPYYQLSLKKDGKRKVKFSAWGGKRSPPIIGPIWTQAPQDTKDATLNGILLIKNADDKSLLQQTAV